VIRDPLARLPTGLRFGLAAVLSLLALGLPWRTAFWTFAGRCDGRGACGPEMARTTGAESPARIVLVGAFLALAAVAIRTRTPATRRIARAGTGCLAIAAALAAADRSVPILVCGLAALALTGPPAWRSGPNRRIFGTAPLDR
jgi:hypothetical protein